MFKLFLLFNLKKITVNKQMEILFFLDKQKDNLRVDLTALGKKIEKLKAKDKKTEKQIVELSKMEAELQRVTPIQNTLKQFEAEVDYYKGLSKTIKQNFWNV